MGSKKTYIFGVRIYLRSAIATDTDLGLYAVTAANSQLRWIEDDISSYSPTVAWKTGMLSTEWIGDIEESADFSVGGDLPAIGGTTLTITNLYSDGGTITQLDKTFQALGISLPGLVCEIVRFEISSGALVDADGTVAYRMLCGAPSWTETTMSIPLETARLMRRANLATLVDATAYPNAEADSIGDCIPIALGTFIPEYDVYNNLTLPTLAKAIRVANAEQVYKTSNAVTSGFPTYVNSDSGQAAFYVAYNAGSSPYVTYYIRMTESEFAGSPAPQEVSGFINMYMRVSKGKGEKEIRKIVDAEALPGNYYQISITINAPFEEQLSASVDGRATDQSWVEFISTDKTYVADVWPFESLATKNGAKVDSGFSAYGYIDTAVVEVTGENQTTSIVLQKERFEELPQGTFDINTSAKKNDVKINLKNNVGGSLDNLDDYIFLPCTNLRPYSAGSLKGFDQGAGDTYSDYLRDVTGGVALDGLYRHSDDDDWKKSPELTFIDDISYVKLSLSIDSFAELDNIRHALVIICDPPALPDNIEFEEMFLVSEMWANHWNIDNINDANTIITGLTRFEGYCIDALNRTIGAKEPLVVSAADGVRRSCRPAFYVPDGGAAGTDSDFYYSSDTSGDPLAEITGINNFALNIGSVSEYRTIKYFAWMNQISVNFDADDLSLAHNLIVYKYPMIALRKRISLTDAVYLPAYARKFNDTWGSRKNADITIANPIDVSEHICRLQNWSETGEELDWGKAYATAPLIDTGTTEGGFDNDELDLWRTTSFAHQILELNDGYTDAILRKIARKCFLTFYQAPATGNESVVSIGDKYGTAPATTITLDDIVGPIGTVGLFSTADVYTEPYVRFAKNIASGKFDRLLAITNTGAATYDASYVIGASGADAEMLWTKAHVLRTAVGTLLPPPPDMTEHDFIYDLRDAVTYLDAWLTYMGAISSDGTLSGVIYRPKKRISFSVPYELGAAWHIGKHINLQLPHQTDDTAIECCIEQIRQTMLRGSELTTVRVIMYNYTDDISTYVQDTMTTGTSYDDWQDHMQTLAERGSGGADIQDT